MDRLDRRFEQVGKTAQPPEDRLGAIESQLAKLAADVAALTRAVDAGPAPQPREQERLEVDKPAPARKRSSAKKSAS